MVLKVQFTRRAIADLKSIHAWLRERSSQATERVRAHIAATIDRLADLPLLGRRTDDPNVRVAQLTRYPYRVFYKVGKEDLIIVHIRHVARREIDPHEL